MKPGEFIPGPRGTLIRNYERYPAPVRPEFDRVAASGTNPVFQAALEWEKKEWRIRENAYLKALNDTGLTAKVGDYLKRKKAESQMLCLSDAIAERMERLGLGGFRSPDLDPVWVYGAFSGETYELPNYRRNKFVPAICHEKRANMVNELEYFIRMNPGRCRMLVFNGRWNKQLKAVEKSRCTSLQVAESWQWQNFLINKWNKSHAARKFGAYIVFRSNELGSPLKKEADKTRDAKTGKFKRAYIRDANGDRVRNLDSEGRQTYHPHTHAVLHLSGWVDLKALVKELQKHFYHVKPDHGVINDAREACKYMMKCDEIMELRDMDFIRIFRRLNKRRTVASYGALRKQVLKHKAECEKLRRMPNETGEQLELAPVKNHNQKPLGFKDDGVKPPSLGKQLDPVMVARCAPSARFTPIAEPCFVFRGAVSPEKAAENKHVQFAMKETADLWRAGIDQWFEQHRCDPVHWATEVAPLLQEDFSDTETDSILFTDAETIGRAPRRAVSAHTTPVTFAEKSRATPSGASPLLGDGAKPPPDGETIASESPFGTQKRKNPVAYATGASPLLGAPLTNDNNYESIEKLCLT